MEGERASGQEGRKERRKIQTYKRLTPHARDKAPEPMGAMGQLWGLAQA